jgi:NAD(P)-dependent dehydrogenase (short-subunit alcohol dehydrogenase family)
VTGGSRGIGAAVVQDLTSRGYEVFALSRSGNSNVGTAVACDVSNELELMQACASILSHGPVSLLVNNAGAYSARRSAELSAEEYNRIINLNATSMMVASRELYPGMRDQGGGLIINMGSFFDRLGVAGSVAYCASKAAVGALTRCLAVEWALDNIYVINVAPGYVETDLSSAYLEDDENRKWLNARIPIGRPAQPSEVATVVGQIVESGGALLTGQTVYMDGAHGINQ